MVTVNNDIIVKDTGWQLPTQISQYNEYGIINTETCYAYSNLPYLKQRDNTCASIDGVGGVNNIHHSPLIYCYGYGFNIPIGATITKIQVRQRRKCNTTQQKSNDGIKDRIIRLKIGASVKDYGEGHNNSQEAKWSTKEQGLTDYTSGNYDNLSVYEVWGVVVTPAMANNQNFGCVIQCTGKTDLMMQPVIDSVEIKISYTQLGTTSTTPEKTTETVINKNQSPQATSEINLYYKPDNQEEPTHNTEMTQSVDLIYTPMTFYIRYINNAITNNQVTYIEEAHHDKIKITLDKLRFQDGSTTKTIPVQTLKGSTDKIDLRRGYISQLQIVQVYPTEEGTATVTIEGLRPNVNTTSPVTQTVEFNITPSTTNTSNSICTISNSTFNNCNATEGKAIYNYGKLTYSNITINGVGTNTKYLFDYDKYRDGEFVE